MLTFFASLCHKEAKSPSLKLSISGIIYLEEIVGAGLQKATVSVMKNIKNHINPLIYSEHAQLLYSFTPLSAKFPLFEIACLCHY